MTAIAVVLVSIATGVDPECRNLIEANAQSLDLIRTIQATYTISWINNPEEVVAEVTWAREGVKERVSRISYPEGPASGRNARSVQEFVLDGRKIKHLSNWDPENPPRITPTNQNGVRANIMPQTSVNPAALSPAEQLRFELDAMPRRTLSELAEVSPHVECKGKVPFEERYLWQINLESPEETTPTTTKRRFEVYLDPDAGYLIRKVIVRSDLLSTDGKRIEDAHAHEVLEFKDLGDGVFVPMRIRNGTLSAWGTETVVTALEVNEPIPPETFEMTWPKFALVRHHPPVNGELVFDVWGDGEPLKSFKGSDDLRAFEAMLRRDPAMAVALGPENQSERPPPAMSTLVKLAITFGVLVIVMMTLVFIRRVREQA